jgi:hypothetical protein
MNDAVDLLATRAAATQTAESGDRLDVAALAERTTTKTRGSDGAVVAGHGIVVSGHRPPELGGYRPA